MADNQVEFEVVAKTGPAEKQIKSLADLSQKLLGSIAPGVNIIAINQGIELAEKIFNKAKETIEKPFVLTMEGEKLRAIEGQFAVLSQQAGIVGESLKDGLEKAAGGLADTSDLLGASNKAFIELGANATRLPETLELARKATVAFGGELIQNFEGINQAIATGNVRSLRALGLSIDRDKAERDYAKTLGVSVATLSEAGRQQAFMNAVLEKGAVNFKNVNDTTLATTNALTQLSVAIKDSQDNFKKAFSETFGPYLETFIKGVTHLYREFTGTLPLTEQLQIVNTEIKRIKDAGLEQTMGGALDTLAIKAKKLKDQIEFANIAQQDALVAARRLSGPTLNLVDPEKLEADRLKVREIFSKTNQDLINAQLQVAVQNGDADAIDNLRFQQRFQVVQDFELKKQAIKRDFLAKGLIDQQAYNVLEEQLNEEKNAKIAAMEHTANENILKIRQIVQSNIVNGITSAFSQLGAALAKGSNGFEAFGKAVISALGAMAIQIGTLLVTIGLGFETLGPILPVFGLSGASAVIAGLGLIALGGALQAVGGGGGGGGDVAGGVAASAGGGVAGGGGLSAGATAITSLNASQTGTAVNINISGNILDRRQTGLEIAEVMQEHFNNNGNLIVGGNF